ncbi:organoarsenical effux MFS transporter ArsJ [Pseudoalteromonas sp. G4]|uniref:organoarsenical effux MFS transporter ArsJ n=1 Tax=Pseudoalteromonas sp. G4 TaxID=2992761 RepID=UPI00237D3731|nr:organoarsenical effux MFS transporter ArsJ [Pseudoalteromonas sp. G4]MDE3271597.1 organoarsenical effux MFS transporter ArsJ [Pseudoalteromonas sp. G4]
MLAATKTVNQGIKDYIQITFAYWGFTLTDGALRMLVVLYFHTLGYSPIEVAMLFLFYEFFGIVTNLFGGWLGARFGLKVTLFSGLFLQISALLLLAQTQWLSVAYVMALQAISGIAKDLNKMSAKTAIKQLVPKNENSTLFKWVALLTGSKNTLKGCGFFLGGLLLAVFGYQHSLYILAAGLGVISLLVALQLKGSLEAKAYKPKFSHIFSSSNKVNLLSFARCFLFASRDVWFVVALPVFLTMQAGWTSTEVGTMMAAWVIIYGIFQSTTPKAFKLLNKQANARAALIAAIALLMVILLMLLAAYLRMPLVDIAILGLILFAIIFAINSAIHSFLIVHYARDEGASMDVGLYYMANACGRLFGTVLSGVIYQQFGLVACLIVSGLFVAICLPITAKLTQNS